MVSLIATPSIHFMVSRQPISYLSSPSYFPIVFVISPLKREHPLRSKRKQLKHKKQNQFLFEFSGFCGVVRECKNWEGEGDPALELEVLEFMKNSKNPNMFPSRKELIDAGRVDLLEAIVKRGGWMTMGWEDEDAREVSEDGLASNWEFSLEKYGQIGSEDVEKSGSEPNEERHCEGISFLGNSSTAASSSGRSLEMTADDDSGIEGILNRLVRQRNLSFGFKLGNHVNGDFGGNNQNEGIRKDVDSCHPQRSEPASLIHNRPTFVGNGLSRSYSNGSSSSLNTDTWRTWSIQRAGFPNTEFEAGEIDFAENTTGRTVDKSMGDIIVVSTDINRAQDNPKQLNPFYREITQGDLKTRVQHLEVELSSALHSLRSNASDLSGKAKEHLSEDLRQLSDASEFQENEIMNAQDKLRSLRAKLAVLEGKMALAIMDAQKILDEKQKRIDDARIALQLLRTTCIVWPNSGSEVLLAGSFDGWATQRKMTRSSTGIFSLCLKLYPGKYEIKFIVDGVWKVDPLRPIVGNNGFENNLLTIT